MAGLGERLLGEKAHPDERGSARDEEQDAADDERGDGARGKASAMATKRTVMPMMAMTALAPNEIAAFRASLISRFISLRASATSSRMSCLASSTASLMSVAVDMSWGLSIDADALGTITRT